jgi:hypothetical protein
VTKEELRAKIYSLDPGAWQIAEALTLLRLVLENNPNRSIDEILERTDVIQAIETIDEWMDETAQAAQALAGMLTPKIGIAIRADTSTTLAKLESDTRFSRETMLQGTTQKWGAGIILRMRWLLAWMVRNLDLVMDAPYKVWRSRLAYNSCRYCLGLHGAVIPAKNSFRPLARRLGWTRFYGGLYGPPLHPSCQCWLEPVSREVYEALTQQGRFRAF